MNRYDERRAYDILAIANYTNLSDVPKGTCDWFGGVVSSIVNRGRSHYDTPDLIPVFIESVSSFMDLYPAPELSEPYGDKMRSYAERVKEVYTELSASEKQYFLENVGMSEAILLVEMKKIAPLLESKIQSSTKDDFDYMVESMDNELSTIFEESRGNYKKAVKSKEKEISDMEKEKAKKLKELDALAKAQKKEKMKKRIKTVAKVAVVAGGAYVATNALAEKQIKGIDSRGRAKLSKIKRIKDTIQSETEQRYEAAVGGSGAKIVKTKSGSHRRLNSPMSNRIRATGKIYIDRVNTVFNETVREYKKASSTHNKHVAVMEKDNWKELERIIEKGHQEAKKLLAEFRKEIKALKS